MKRVVGMKIEQVDVVFNRFLKSVMVPLDVLLQPVQDQRTDVIFFERSEERGGDSFFFCDI